jgi:hypothetical protein
VRPIAGRLCQTPAKNPSVTSASSAELRGRDSTGNQFPGPAEALAKEATIYIAEPFPHNLALISVLYSGERPEITPHDEESEKGQNKQNQIKQRKKR